MFFFPVTLDVGFLVVRFVCDTSSFDVSRFVVDMSCFMFCATTDIH